MLEIRIKDREFKNPIFTASGTFSPDFKDYCDTSKIGAIFTKTITFRAKEGNPPERLWEVPCGLINSIGLDNPGVDEFRKKELPEYFSLNTDIFVSIGGEKIEEFCKIIEKLEDTQIAGFELNLSCPNVKKGREFCKDLKNLEKLLKEVRKLTEKIIICKLSAMVNDICEVAKVCEDNGADALTLINTLPAFAVDVDTKRPRLGGVTGGLSGPAIKPVALWCVYKVRKVCKIPIIGCGGITSLMDVLEYLISGATAVQVGTYNFVNHKICEDLVDNLISYLKSREMSLSELIGSINDKVNNST